MSDQQELEQFTTLQPDLIAAIRELVREEIRKWAEARRDGLMREKAHIEKEILQKS